MKNGISLLLSYYNIPPPGPDIYNQEMPLESKLSKKK